LGPFLNCDTSTTAAEEAGRASTTEEKSKPAAIERTCRLFLLSQLPNVGFLQL